MNSRVCWGQIPSEDLKVYKVLAKAKLRHEITSVRIDMQRVADRMNGGVHPSAIALAARGVTSLGRSPWRSRVASIASCLCPAFGPYSPPTARARRPSTMEKLNVRRLSSVADPSGTRHRVRSSSR